MRRLGTLAAAIALLAAAPASADTFTVNTTADPGGSCPGATCSIRGALDAADNTPATTDTIVVPAGIYQLVGAQLDVDSPVVVRGSGARATVVRGNKDAQSLPTFRVFDVQGVEVRIESLAMENGSAQLGGNLQNGGGNVVLDHVRVTGGAATGGGGIANDGGTMTIQSSLIDANNVATSNGNGDGGGILNISGNAQAVLTVRDTTITGNTAVAPGGGIASTSRTGQPTVTTLERVTLARNQATSGVGGVALVGAGSFTLRESVVDDNTTVPGSTAPFESNCGSATIASGGGNVAGSGTPQCAFAAGGDVVGADALLSALENQGGQTDVLRLLPGSPAINRTGSCTGADQRDLPRPQGGACDSGAYEVDQAPDTTVVATPPTFSFASSEPGVSFQCRIDRPGRPGTFAGCTSPASYASLRQGSYSFVVRAVDSGGAADPSPAVASFIVQPQATAGKFVLVKEVRGRVRVKRPGGRYVNLNNLTEIPDGSLVDTRKGVVRLSFQPRAGAKLQTAKFWDGIFKVDQRKKIMELALVEKLAKCAQQGNATTAAKKKKSRRLWGDGKGRFRTKGQYSSATVRGTRWLTQDSCAGTLTRVRKGKVNVRDFVRKRTIRLKKGQQYLARPG